MVESPDLVLPDSAAGRDRARARTIATTVSGGGLSGIGAAPEHVVGDLLATGAVLLVGGELVFDGLTLADELEDLAARGLVAGNRGIEERRHPHAGFIRAWIFFAWFQFEGRNAGRGQCGNDLWFAR